MAYSVVSYSGDGVTTQFVVPFTVLDRSHLKAYVNGVQTAFVWLNDGLISIIPAPAVAAQVALRRDSNRTGPLVDFRDGSVLTEADLDLANQQAICVAQEAFDAADEAVQSEQLEAFSLAAQAAASAAAVSATSASNSANAAAASAVNAAQSAIDAANAASLAGTKVDKQVDNLATNGFRLTTESNTTYDLESNTLAAVFAHKPALAIGGVSTKTYSPYFTKFSTQGLVNSFHSAFRTHINVDAATTGGTVFGNDTTIVANNVMGAADVFGNRVTFDGNAGKQFANASVFRADLVNGLGTSSGVVGFDIYLGNTSLNRGLRIAGDSGVAARVNRAISIENTVAVDGAILQWAAQTGSPGDFLALLDNGYVTKWTVGSNGDTTWWGTGQRIKGEFFNATDSDRTLFQSRANNQPTIVGAVPTGTGNAAGFLAYGTSDPNNSGLAFCGVQGGNAGLFTFATGGGVVPGINLSANGVVGLEVTGAGVVRSRGNVVPPVISKSVSYVATVADGVILADASAGSITITLPAANAAAAGRAVTLRVKRKDAVAANTVTITRAGADTLEGGTSTTLAPLNSKDFVSDGATAWWIV